jgi:hypothetical protein
MGAFAQVRSEVRAPGKLVTLRPGDFADEWRNKPKGDIVLGLRLIPAREEESARSVAAKAELAADTAEAAIVAYNRAAMGWIVARSICDPNSVTKPHPAFPDAEDQIPDALTTSALARIFDAIEAYQVEASPIFREATDDECLDLCALLEGEEILPGLDPIKAARVRRFLAFALDELAG